MGIDRNTVHFSKVALNSSVPFETFAPAVGVPLTSAESGPACVPSEALTL